MYICLEFVKIWISNIRARKLNTYIVPIYRFIGIESNGTILCGSGIRVDLSSQYMYYIYICIYLSIFLFVYLYVNMYMSINLSIYLGTSKGWHVLCGSGIRVDLSSYILYVYLYMYLSFYLSFYSIIYKLISICLSTYLSIQAYRKQWHRSFLFIIRKKC